LAHAPAHGPDRRLAGEMKVARAALSALLSVAMVVGNVPAAYAGEAPATTGAAATKAASTPAATPATPAATTPAAPAATSVATTSADTAAAEPVPVSVRIGKVAREGETPSEAGLPVDASGALLLSGDGWSYDERTDVLTLSAGHAFSLSGEACTCGVVDHGVIRAGDFGGTVTVAADGSVEGGIFEGALDDSAGGTVKADGAVLLGVENSLEGLTSDNPAATVAAGSVYSETLAASGGGALPEEVSVTLDGKAAEAGADYSWDSATGRLSVPAATGEKLGPIRVAAKAAPAAALSAQSVDPQATAGTIDVAGKSSVTIFADHYVVDNVYYTSWSGDVTLTGTGDCTVTLNIGTGTTAKKVILDNLTLSGDRSTIACAYDGARIWLASGTVNTVTSTKSGVAAIDSGNSSLVIGGEGKLNATGASYAAGIGRGQYRDKTSDVTIEGGTINATGGWEAAGIGGGDSNTGDTTVTINGGTITATGGNGGAGIGAGYKASGTTTVNVTGGTIAKATSVKYGAGIGGGQYLSGPLSVSFSGGTVTDAEGGYEAAGIGGGDSATSTTAVAIKGGTVAYSYGGSGGAGIGSGYKAAGAATVTVTGGTLGKITADDDGAGIGGGQSATGSLSIELTGGSLSDCLGGLYGAGIGSGKGASGSLDVTMGGTFEAEHIKGGGSAAGIGSGYGSRLDKVLIGESCDLKDVEAGADAAGIGAGSVGTGDSSAVEITGGSVVSKSASDSDVSAQTYGAGIGEGNSSTAVAVTISGGSVTATSNTAFGAGIGGDGNGLAVGKVTITGGTVTAKGGSSKLTDPNLWSGASGIGGTLANGFDVTITGGTVTASSASGGAGIGGGCKGPSGKVSISGGTIDATGGERATGIGSGYKAYDCTVDITGGRIKATGSIAPGIGCGDGADSCTVKISSSTVASYGGSNSSTGYPGIDAGEDGKVVIASGNVMAVNGAHYTGQEVCPTPCSDEYSNIHVGRTLLTLPLGSGGEQKVAWLRYIYGNDEIAKADDQVYTQNGGQVYWYLPLQSDAVSKQLYRASANVRQDENKSNFTLHPVSVGDAAFQNYIFDEDKGQPIGGDFQFTLDGQTYDGGSTVEIDYDGQSHAADVSATASAAASGIGSVSAVRYKYEYYTGDYAADAPKGAGTYDLYIDTTETTSYDAASDLKVGKIVVKLGENPARSTSYSGVYDGQEHTVGVVNLPATSYVQYETYNFSDAYSSTPRRFCRPVNAEMVRIAVSDPNYWIYWEPTSSASTVTITKRPITVTANSATVTYDGTEHSVLGNTVTGAADGDAVSATVPYECKGTDVGTYTGKLTGTMTATAQAVSAHGSIKAGEDVTDCYDVQPLVCGTLTVNPATVTVTGASATVVENGSEQSVKGYTTSGLASGDTLEVTYSAAKGAVVGSYDGSFSGTAVIKDASGNDKTKDYVVKLIPGKLTIQTDPNYVTATGYTGAYNGSPHGITAEKQGVVTGIEYSTDQVNWSSDNPSFTDAGTHIVYARGTLDGGSTTDVVSATVEIDPLSAVADVAIADQTYTGKAIEPASGAFTVKVGSTTLAGTDYGVTYDASSNNTKVGTATCTVTLKGNYEGSTTAHFSIRPKTIEVPTATQCTYDGQEKTGVSAQDTDPYAVTGGSATDAGTYTATAVLRDKDNTTWADGTTADKQVSWTIAKAAAPTLTVAGYSGTYDGAAHAAAASVTGQAGGSTLQYSTDGGVTWLDAAPAFKDAGTYAIEVRATNPNYADATSNNAAVTIGKAKLTATYAGETVGYGDKPAYAVDVTGWANGETARTAAGYTAPTVTDGPTIPAAIGTYSGLTPSGGSASNYVFSYVSGALTVTKKTVTIDEIEGSSKEKTYTGSAITLSEDDVQVDVVGITLTYGTDYKIVDGSYKDNVNVGTGTFTLQFMGNYSGTLEDVPGVIILPADASNATVSGVVDKPFTGDPVEQDMTVTFNGTTLVAGTDYDVRYEDNVEAGTASYTIEYKGNHTGSTSGTFKVDPAAASASTILPVADQAYTGSAVEPDLTVIAPDGKTLLEKGTDYDVTYSKNTDAGTATATLTFKGNYAGSASGDFKIVPADISSAVAVSAIPDQTYTGSALTPAPAVTLNGKALVAGTDYDVTYSKNTDAGTATATLTFKGNYAGSRDCTFKIVPADANDAKVSGIEASYAYTGSAITPAPAVTLGGRTLVAGTDYDVTYSSNVRPGTAGYVIAFKGNYAGTATGTFAITPVREAALVDRTGSGLTQAGLDQALAAAALADPSAASIVVDLRVAVADATGVPALAIRALPAASGLAFDRFWDAVLTKTVDGVTTDIGSANDALVAVTYPFDFSGKGEVRVFACHAGSAYELAATPNAYGEYAALDRAAGTVTVFAKRYSTFGIGYARAATSGTIAPVAASASSASSGTAATGDPSSPAAPAALALAGLAALALAARRRRRG
jgi:hypothetical protein